MTLNSDQYLIKYIKKQISLYYTVTRYVTIAVGKKVTANYDFSVGRSLLIGVISDISFLLTKHMRNAM